MYLLFLHNFQILLLKAELFGILLGKIPIAEKNLIADLDFACVISAYGSGSITNCLFDDNQAQSGWGGAVFGSNTVDPLNINGTKFFRNKAISSYTNNGAYV